MRVCSLGYVAVESPEAKQWEEFGSDILGMEVVESGAGTVRLRFDDHHHRLAVHLGERDRIRHAGWDIGSEEALEAAVDELGRLGIPCREGTEEEADERKVRRFVAFSDPGGNRHEIFYGALRLPGRFRPGRPLSGFVTGDQGFGHILLVVPDLAGAMQFYRNTMGFRLSDEMFTFIDGYFLRCNPRHHSLALSEIPRVRGLHHLMVQLNSLDDVGVAYDRCLDRSLPITMTLGRHTNDRMVSFYVRSPSGFEVEYGWGGLAVDEATWTTTDQYESVSIWGHRMVGTSPPAALEEAVVPPPGAAGS